MWGDLVSIIVPVYNVKEYLGECLESIINQTYQNLEIIVINDGSTDGSDMVCKAYADRDVRIRYIDQKNGGVVRARKAGVELAKGKYIGFVDGDDYIDNDTYEKLMIISENCDLVTAGYKKEVNIFDLFEPGLYSTSQEIEYIVKNMIIYQKTSKHGINTSMTNKLFRTVLVKETMLEVDENVVFAEDGEFVYRYILKCKTIWISDICGYFYRNREESAVHSVNKQHLANINRLYCNLEQVFTGHVYQVSLLRQLQKWVSGMLLRSASHMGFEPLSQCISYVFPFINLLDNTSIALYGAGKVGQNYYMLITNKNICKIVGWVDRDWEKYREKGMDVCSTESLLELSYEYVVIAVQNKELAEVIKKQLVMQGITEEKILWKEPLCIEMG